jgi:hypothetical protein
MRKSFGFGFRGLAATTAFVGAMAVTGPANAADEGETSYAWQTVSLDAAAVGLMAAGVANDLDTWPHTTVWSRLVLDGHAHHAVSLTDVGFGVYTFGAPSVHLLHGRPVPSLASLGLRALAPSVGLLVGGSIGVIAGLFAGDCQLDGGCRHEDTAHTVAVTGIGAGLLVGFAGPSLVDAFFLAREPAPPAPATPGERPPPAAIMHVAPRVAVTPGGGSVGLGGTF